MLSQQYAQYHQTEGATSSTIPIQDKLRVQTTFVDGTELVEEFSAASGDLLARRWRSADALGRQGAWEHEIGDPPAARGGQASEAAVVEGMFTSRVNPSFHPRDNTECWEWRVRNLPYPLDTYSITVEKEGTELVLRTSNKKYFKRWKVPFLVRLGLLLEDEHIEFDHQNNTLIIQYAKPTAVLELEADRRQRVRAAAAGAGGEGGGVPECKPS